MKKLFYMVLAMLCLTTTVKVAAQSKFAVSNLPLSVIESGTADDKIVNQSGMTGKSVRLMLDAWCQNRANITLHQLVTEGSKTPITTAHGNSESLPSGLHAYYDNSPTGEVWMWNGTGLIKDECCNLVANSDGVIQNFLKSYFSQNQGHGSGSVINPGDGQPDQQETKKENDMSVTNNYFQGLPSAAQQPIADHTPWGWILAIIGIVALIVIGLIVMMSIMNNRRNTHREMLREREDSIAGHYSEVKLFLKTARQMNTDNADNAREVHNTWTTVNGNPPQQGGH